MFIPQQIEAIGTRKGRAKREGIRQFDSADCYELLDSIVSRGTDVVVVLESATGDLRDYTFVYKNAAFAKLTAPTTEGGHAVRSTFLVEFFNDSGVLKRVYDAVEAGERSREEHLTRSLDGDLRLMQVEISGLSPSDQGVARWLGIIKDITEESNGAKLHGMLAGAHCMVWHSLVEDLDGQLLWTFRVVNEESADRWLPIRKEPGMTFADSWTMAWHNDDLPRLHARSEAAIWGGETAYRQQFRCNIADGSVRWISEDVQIDSRGPGRWRLVGVCTDITEQKKVEEALRHSEQRLSLHVQQTPLAVIEWDVNFQVSDWNPSAERIFGHTRQQALGQHAAGLIMSSDAQDLATEIWRAIMTGKGSDERTIENVTKDGRTIICQWYNTALVDDTGELIGAASLALDVTDRMRAEKLLVQEGSLFKVLMDNIPDSVFIKDDKSRYQRLSRHLATHQLRVSDPAEAVGKTDFDFFDTKYARQGYEDEQRIIRTGEPILNKLEPESSEDGSIRWMSTTRAPIFDERGKITGTVGISRDITEQLRAEEERREAERELQNVVAKARCVVWHAVVEDMGDSMQWDLHISDDQAAQRWLPIDVPPGRSYDWAWAMAQYTEDKARMDETCTHAIRSGQGGYTQEFRCRLASGDLRWLSEDVQIEPMGSNKWRLVGVCTDITARKRAEDLLASERNQLRTLIDNLPISVYFKDPHCRFIINNAKHAHLLGAKDSGAIAGKSNRDFFPVNLAEQYEEDERMVLSTGLPLINKEEPFVDPDGNHLWYSTTKVPLRDRTGAIIGLVGISQDITQQKAMDAERERMLTEAIERADRDPLTGLLNHRAFHKRLREEADRAVRNGRSMAVAVMDMDNFKFFNDAYGHAVGDSVLCQVAAALHECCRSYDVLARFGGDEFALLMPDTDAEEAANIADRLVKCLDGVGYKPPEYDMIIPLSISVGMAVFPDDGATRLEVLTVADDRLLRIKSGAGSDELLTEELRNRLSEGFAHFSMLNALVSAVDNKDRYTRRHSEDVLTYSVEIARELGFQDNDIFWVQVAALLHDVGKIGVPDAILRKPGRLTDDEFNAIKQHPVMGMIMVGAMPGFEPILDAVRHHHERWDGLGYPDALAGTAIPLTARLMAVADAFSAMTTDRPYRKGMDPVVALKVLEDGAGTQWDPVCVKAFLGVRREILRKQGRTDV